MKSRVLFPWWLAFGLLTAGNVRAADPAPLTPVRSGYAFESPRLLEQQRLFGRAHGVALLADACASSAVYRDEVRTAYAQWQDAQGEIIANSAQELARHYFAGRAAEASPADIARAMKLVDHLGLKPDSKPFNAACATFAEALQKPRYDLRGQFRLQSFAARLAAAERIEGAAEMCRPTQTDSAAGSDAATLDAALAQWRQRYAASIAEARAALEADWPLVAAAGGLADAAAADLSLAAWLQAAREHGKQRTNPAQCRALSAKLLTPAADPDHAFNAIP